MDSSLKLLRGYIYYFRLRIKFFVYLLKSPTYFFYPKIFNKKDTVNKIITGKISISRFGDGEFGMIYRLLTGNESISKFQNYSDELAKKLRDVLSNSIKNPNLLICIPAPFLGRNLKNLVLNSRIFWLETGCIFFPILKKCFYKNKSYGESTFTRFYLSNRNKNRVNEYIDLLKQIWKDRNLLIVEGKYSRLGVGNDLFDNAKSIRRILCPEKNAFESYDAIRESIIKNAEKEDLILLALGMTATVMAADLSEKGFQTIDIGHIDIEYEWWLKGAKEKIAVKNKFTNEANENVDLEGFHDPVYEGQIIDTVE